MPSFPENNAIERSYSQKIDRQTPEKSFRPICSYFFVAQKSLKAMPYQIRGACKKFCGDLLETHSKANKFPLKCNEMQTF